MDIKKIDEVIAKLETAKTSEDGEDLLKEAHEMLMAMVVPVETEEMEMEEEEMPAMAEGSDLIPAKVGKSKARLILK